ncbi:hypothetical protein, partial [Janibacter melonis]
APRRRGGRRAATSGAPVTLQAVDLTASAPSEPITAVAGAVGGAAEPTPSPEAEQTSTPAPRRKRKRVTSEAGPPTAGE